LKSFVIIARTMLLTATYSGVKWADERV